MSDPIKYAPIIPRIDPTAAPIKVFSDERRIRNSKKMMAAAIIAAAAAEYSGCAGIGCRKYPAPIKNPAKTSLMRTTSNRITAAS
jgi:hypothetical protein